MDEILCCLAIVRMVVSLLLPERNPQDDPQATDHKRLKKDSTLQAMQQGWKDYAVKDPNLGAGLDLALMPQDV